MRIPAFIIVMVELLARHLNLFASRRLLLDTLTMLFERRRPPGTWPTLSEWVALIEHIRADSTSRLGQYREATLYGLKSILRGLGQVVNCTSSNMLDRMYGELQTFIIITDGLSADLASFLASLMMFWAYESREWVSDAVRPPLIFVLDDALPMVLGTGLDVEGGLNPLSTWAFMGRGRGMGMVVSAQNFSLIHPALRNNTDTIMAFASYGRDAEELSRFMNLTREQAAMLPILRPGQAVALARSAWPLAVHGLVPRVR